MMLLSFSRQKVRNHKAAHERGRADHRRALGHGHGISESWADCTTEQMHSTAQHETLKHHVPENETTTHRTHRTHSLDGLTELVGLRNFTTLLHCCCTVGCKTCHRSYCPRAHWGYFLKYSARVTKSHPPVLAPC
jgi:hypothetical protein